jgi:hypothetical protein
MSLPHKIKENKVATRGRTRPRVMMALSAAALFGGAVLGSAQPASAHQTQLFGQFSNATVSADHLHAQVCHLGPGSAGVLLGTAQGVVGLGAQNGCNSLQLQSAVLSYILCDDGGCVGRDA